MPYRPIKRGVICLSVTPLKANGDITPADYSAPASTIPTTMPVMAMAAGMAMPKVHFIVLSSARIDSSKASSLAPNAAISAFAAK